MAIYIRTRQGQAAALNPHSALPRKLRTLLISIDGKTATKSDAKNTPSAESVASLLESLLSAGLIEALPDTAQATTPVEPAIESKAEPSPASAVEPDAVAEWERTAVQPRQ